MSTIEKASEKNEVKKDQVEEVTEKLGELNVDNKEEANGKPARRNFPARRGGYRGRGAKSYTPRVPYSVQLKNIEEAQKKKKVVETGVKGYVKWFSVRGRYGFVARENGKDEKEDFFVHQTAIIKSSTIKVYLRTLEDEEPVVFDIVEGSKGLEAANVTGPDGENVKGSRYSRQLLFRFRRPVGPPRRRKTTDNGTAVNEEKKSDENADGEVRSAPKRRQRRARGKLAPDAQNESGVEQNKDGHKEDQGTGDGSGAALATGEKKGVRRNNNRNKNKKKGGAKAEGEQEVAAPKEISA